MLFTVYGYVELRHGAMNIGEIQIVFLYIDYLKVGTM